MVLARKPSVDHHRRHNYTMYGKLSSNKGLLIMIVPEHGKETSGPRWLPKYLICWKANLGALVHTQREDPLSLQSVLNSKMVLSLTLEFAIFFINTIIFCILLLLNKAKSYNMKE